MKYAPPRDNRLLYAVCIPLVVLSFGLFYASNFLPYPGLFQAVGAIMLIVFLFLNLRFSLSAYRYEIDRSSLIVYRRQGRREEAMCNIELSSALLLCTKQEFEQEKPRHELRYNFCQNFGSKNRSYFLFVFDDVEDKRALIIFEPNDEMKALLTRFLPTESKK